MALAYKSKSLRIVMFVIKIIGHTMTQVFSTKLYYVDLYLLLTIRIVYMYYKASNIYVLGCVYI